MKKVLWTKYFMLTSGYSAKFVSVGLDAIIDLNNENTSIETLKKLYDMGIPNIKLTEEGEKKYFPSKTAFTSSSKTKNFSGK